MDNFLQLLERVLGPDVPTDSLTIGQVAARAFVVYILGLAIIRIGNTRLLARYSAFDIILGFILGSLLSRGINGHAALSTSLAASATLVLLHSLISTGTYYSDALGVVLKGKPYLLVKNGEVLTAALRRCKISHHDLEEELHLNANLTDLKKVDAAFMERNGEVSIIPAAPPPHVLEVSVQAGVQTVRIELQKAK